MKTGALLGPFLCVSIVLLSSSGVWGRTWTTTEGLRCEGELLGVEGERVTLSIEGREYLFPLARFSSADRDFLKAWQTQDRCGACRKALSGDRMSAGNRTYHPQCFRCLVCRRPFLDRESIRSDEWGGMVHAEHFRAAKSCGSCGRMFSEKEARAEQFFSDGRFSCADCLRDAVTDLGTLDAVSDRVRRGTSELGLPAPRGPLTMRLVNQGFLEKQIERAHGRGSLRGLTATTFRTVTGGPNAGTTFSHEIMILSGLPVVECVSILAHEFGHVWLNENYVDASPPAVEGFCNLLSMHALQKETSKLADVLRENLKMSDDPVYGRGFREMSKRLQMLGWPGLIRDLSSRRVDPAKRRN